MEVIEAIHTRRSVRRYQTTLVPEELIQELLAAAMSAPTPGTRSPGGLS